MEWKEALHLLQANNEEDAFSSTVSGVAPGATTLVILMGIARSAPLASRLLAQGWDRQTPAAPVVDGSRPTQQVWRGTLDDMARGRATIDGSARSARKMSQPSPSSWMK